MGKLMCSPPIIHDQLDLELKKDRIPKKQFQRIKKTIRKYGYVLKYTILFSFNFITRYWIWFLIIYLFLQIISNQTQVEEWVN